MALKTGKLTKTQGTKTILSVDPRVYTATVIKGSVRYKTGELPVAFTVVVSTGMMVESVCSLDEALGKEVVDAYFNAPRDNDSGVFGVAKAVRLRFGPLDVSLEGVRVVERDGGTVDKSEGCWLDIDHSEAGANRVVVIGSGNVGRDILLYTPDMTLITYEDRKGKLPIYWTWICQWMLYTGEGEDKAPAGSRESTDGPQIGNDVRQTFVVQSLGDGHYSVSISKFGVLTIFRNTIDNINYGNYIRS